MRAVTYHRYGPPEVLQLAEAPVPARKENEILIRVHAAEVTKADCELRSFRFPVSWFWLPLRIAMGIRRPKRPILGGYFAGEIISLGSLVRKFKVGERVFGSSQLKLGAYGEYLSLPENYTVVPMPESLSYNEAAAIPLGGLNALHFLSRARIQSGERILINGAGGSIGIYGVQIARSTGAHVTAVDAGHKEKMLRDLGFDHFIDYTRKPFWKNGERYDVILDMVAKSSYSKRINSLVEGGRYFTANPRVSVMIRSLATSAFTSKSASFAFAGETVEELNTLAEMIENRKIKPIIDRVYPMRKAAEAHHRVESEQRLGSVILSIAKMQSQSSLLQ